MSKLILHIGHRKTGSSAIQSWLATNADQLKSLGYSYPPHKSADAAAQGLVTQGNGRLVLSPDQPLEQGEIYSNEGLFVRLAKENALDRLLDHVCGDLRVVLYTRNVFGFLISSWGQKVKTAQMKDDLDTYLRSYADDHYGKVVFWIEAAKRHGFDLVLRNYSNHRDEIIEDFCKSALGVTLTGLSQDVPKSVVNRSLTASETYFQLLFNRHLNGPSRDFISYPLVQELPSIRAERPFFSEETFEMIAGRHRDDLTKINAFAPKGEAVEIEDYASLISKAQDTFTFSAGQLEILVQSICQHINDRTLTPGDGEVLRDLAIELEDKPAKALPLMSLAARARPDGKLIQSKLSELQAKVRSESMS